MSTEEYQQAWAAYGRAVERLLKRQDAAWDAGIRRDWSPEWARLDRRQARLYAANPYGVSA